jgi:hypothetical protein
LKEHLLADGLHEDLRRQGDVKRGSDRSFGFTFAVVFAVIALLPLRHHLPVRWWAIAVALAFAVAALAAPRVLAPLNNLWAKVGDLLHKITTPIVMGLLFFGAMTPVAAILRLMGKDPLRLKRDSKISSYWIERRPPGPAPDSLNQAF